MKLFIKVIIVVVLILFLFQCRGSGQKECEVLIQEPIFTNVMKLKLSHNYSYPDSSYQNWMITDNGKSLWDEYHIRHDLDSDWILRYGLIERYEVPGSIVRKKDRIRYAVGLILETRLDENWSFACGISVPSPKTTRDSGVSVPVWILLSRRF